MKFIVDENVSFNVVKELRASGHSVTSIIEGYASIKDQKIYEMLIKEKAILITRDYHFTNPFRYPSEKTKGIIYIRHGNLKSKEEVNIISRFLKTCDFTKIKGSLVILDRTTIRIRPPRGISRDGA